MSYGHVAPDTGQSVGLWLFDCVDNLLVAFNARCVGHLEVPLGDLNLVGKTASRERE